MIDSHVATIRNRDSAPDLLKAVDKKIPQLRYIFAEVGYASDEWTLKIFKPLSKAKGFTYYPRDGLLSALFHG